MTISVNSPVAGASVSGTVNVVGANPQTITVMEGAMALGSVTLPGSFSIPVDTTQLADGGQTLTVGDGTNQVSIAVDVNNGMPAGTLTVVQPVVAPGAAVFPLTGTAGSEWVNVAAWDNASGTKVSGDVAPVGNAFALSINMGTLTGTRQINVIGFSVAAGQPGGTQATASMNVTLAAATPPPPVGVNLGWGAGDHYNQGGVNNTAATLAQKTALLKATNMKTCRQDLYDAGGAAALVNTVIPGMPGITVLPCFAQTPPNNSTPAAAYASGLSSGQMLAGYFAGVVPVIELTNELDWVAITGQFNGKTDGVLPANYDATIAPRCVAYIAGLCNGFRSVDTTSKTLIMLGGIVMLHMGFLQMVRDNIQPNGSAMVTPAATYDMVGIHYYATGGDMQNVSGWSGNYNLWTLLAATTNKPVMFTECGTGATSQGYSVTKAKSYISGQLAEMVAHPQVVGIIWYDLLDSTDGQGIYSNSRVAYGWQQALATFCGANVS